MARKPSTRNKPAAGAAAAPVRNLLAEAVQSLNTNVPLMATEAEMSFLTNDSRGPLVEFNTNMRDGDKIAFRATQLGVQVNAASAAPAQPQTPAPAGWAAPAQPQVPQTPAPAVQPAPGAKAFNFAAGVALPAPRRGGRGSTVYGFEQMAVGHSFFIGQTTDNPNPAKRIASTVSSASARLEPKKFIVRSVTVDDAMSKAWNVPVGTKGAGVWRTA